MEQFSTELLFWKDPPENYSISPDRIVIETEPGTDLWQRTYYGFRNDNAPALLMSSDREFLSFSVKTEFDSSSLYDQCGVVLYQDSENWLKASCEYENSDFQRLGSVVTNYGFSDWATCDISTEQRAIWYRLSRRKNDYCVESSFDGVHYQQMRICHLWEGGGTIHFGLYACSPGQSTFRAVFSEMHLGECVWTLQGDNT